MVRKNYMGKSKQNEWPEEKSLLYFFSPSNFFPSQSAKGRRADEALTKTRVKDGDSDRAERTERVDIGINQGLGCLKREP